MANRLGFNIEIWCFNKHFLPRQSVYWTVSLLLFIIIKKINVTASKHSRNHTIFLVILSTISVSSCSFLLVGDLVILEQGNYPQWVVSAIDSPTVSPRLVARPQWWFWRLGTGRECFSMPWFLIQKQPRGNVLVWCIWMYRSPNKEEIVTDI